MCCSQKSLTASVEVRFWVERKITSNSKSKDKCGGSSPFDFAQGQNDKPKGKVDLHFGAEGLHWLGVGLHCGVGVDHVLLQELVVEAVEGELQAVGDA